MNPIVSPSLTAALGVLTAVSAVSPDLAAAAVSLVASGGSPIAGAGVSSSPEITVGSEGDRLLVVAVGGEGANPNNAVAGVAFNGQAFTLAADGTVAFSHSSLWYLPAPDSVTATIDVTWSQDQFGDGSLAYYVLSGVHQSAPLLGSATDEVNPGSSLSGTVPGVAAGSFLVDSVITNNTPTVAFGDGQNEAWSSGSLGGGATHASSYEAALAGDQTQTASWTGDQRAGYAVAAFQAVPEPTGAALVAISFGLLVFRRRRP